MIRFVLDTNVLISIALARGRLHLLVDAWKGRYCRLLVSGAIFEEYLRALHYPKFRLSPDDIRQLLETEVRPHAEEVKVTSRIEQIPEDPSDNKFLSCAVDGKADWIVTGDRHLLRLGIFRGIRLGTPAQFLTQFGG